MRSSEGAHRTDAQRVCGAFHQTVWDASTQRTATRDISDQMPSVVETEGWFQDPEQPLALPKKAHCCPA